MELFTSSFFHRKKKHRSVDASVYNDEPFRVRFIDEPGYARNIDVQRLISQRAFARNLHRTLVERSDIDLIYSAVPTPEAALVAGKYAKNRNIPFVIDVQDLWPEAMKLIFNIPVLSDFLFFPLRLMSDKVYSMADSIVAVSQTYLERALQSNNCDAKGVVVYLGVDLDYFDAEVMRNYQLVTKPHDEFWLTYVGTLGTSYDIETLIRAVRLLHDRGLFNIRLQIVGDGPLRERFQALALQHSINACFTGWISYSLMTTYLAKSDIVVNAIRKNAPQSITNKIGDYLACGRPVVNGSLNTEFRNMVVHYDIGYNYEPESVLSMTEAIERLYDSGLDRSRKGANARKLAEARFDRPHSYNAIVDVITEALCGTRLTLT